MPENENKKHEMILAKEKLASQAKGLAKWFQIDLTIRIFGVVVYELHYPPQND